MVDMHTSLYADHPDIRCVIHTHSPCATAYVLACRPIGCWIVALAMLGMGVGIPAPIGLPRLLQRLDLQRPLLGGVTRRSQHPCTRSADPRLPVVRTTSGSTNTGVTTCRENHLRTHSVTYSRHVPSDNWVTNDLPGPVG